MRVNKSSTPGPGAAKKSGPPTGHAASHMHENDPRVHPKVNSRTSHGVPSADKKPPMSAHKFSHLHENDERFHAKRASESHSRAKPDDRRVSSSSRRSFRKSADSSGVRSKHDQQRNADNKRQSASGGSKYSGGTNLDYLRSPKGSHGRRHSDTSGEWLHHRGKSYESYEERRSRDRSFGSDKRRDDLVNGRRPLVGQFTLPALLSMGSIILGILLIGFGSQRIYYVRRTNRDTNRTCAQYHDVQRSSQCHIFGVLTAGAALGIFAGSLQVLYCVSFLSVRLADKTHAVAHGVAFAVVLSGASCIIHAKKERDEYFNNWEDYLEADFSPNATLTTTQSTSSRESDIRSDNAWLTILIVVLIVDMVFCLVVVIMVLVTE